MFACWRHPGMLNMTASDCHGCCCCEELYHFACLMSVMVMVVFYFCLGLLLQRQTLVMCQRP